VDNSGLGCKGLVVLNGIIVMWSGAIVDIPVGWHLCDGTEGTPDMRNRFAFGALSQLEMNLSRGQLSHGHEFTGDGHTHVFPVGPFIKSGPHYDAETDEGIADGDTDDTETLPPYYSLAFIMFVGLPG